MRPSGLWQKERVQAGTSKHQHPNNCECVCVFVQGDWESHLGPKWDVRRRTALYGLGRVTGLGVHGARKKINQKLLVSRVNSNFT